VASKYAGYKLGLHYRMVPGALRKYMSFHREYWKTAGWNSH